jgi:hypothetical protein
MLKSGAKKEQGKFWPQVRAMIWEKAQQLYQQDQARGMTEDFTGITATKAELREGGYFYQAKLIVLRDLFLQKKGLPTTEEEEASQKSAQDFLQNR